jgi:hypothetical protein
MGSRPSRLRLLFPDWVQRHPEIRRQFRPAGGNSLAPPPRNRRPPDERPAPLLRNWSQGQEEAHMLVSQAKRLPLLQIPEGCIGGDGMARSQPWSSLCLLGVSSGGTLDPDNRLVQAAEVYAQQFNATIKSPVKSVGMPFCFALCLSSRDYVSVTRRLFARSERMGALRTGPWSGQAAAALCCSSHSLPATQGQC